MTFSNILNSLVGYLRKISILFLFTIVSQWAMASSKSDDLGGAESWYGAWWAWILGIGLFIIVVIAIVSAGQKKA